MLKLKNIKYDREFIYFKTGWGNEKSFYVFSLKTNEMQKLYSGSFMTYVMVYDNDLLYCFEDYKIYIIDQKLNRTVGILSLQKERDSYCSNISILGDHLFVFTKKLGSRLLLLTIINKSTGLFVKKLKITGVISHSIFYYNNGTLLYVYSNHKIFIISEDSAMSIHNNHLYFPRQPITFFVLDNNSYYVSLSSPSYKFNIYDFNTCNICSIKHDINSLNHVFVHYNNIIYYFSVYGF